MITQVPPIIKGHTVSNLILVEISQWANKKKNKMDFDTKMVGFAEPFNSRDVFLNVNYHNERGYQYHNLVSDTIVHEVTHNVLTKYIGEIASIQLDNLFYKKKLKNKIHRLFTKSKKKDLDFWLSGRTR